MNGFKRRRHANETPAAEVEASSVESAVDDAEAQTSMPQEFVLPAHVQRTLIMLTSKLQSAMEHIDALERRIEELEDHVNRAPSHSDVLEVRMHGAKLAAELARTTVELRGEIGMASEEALRVARAAHVAATETESAENAKQEEETIDLVKAEKEQPFSKPA